MVDFLQILEKDLKNGDKEIWPTFRLYPKDGKAFKDLMIRGGDFYAIWVDELGLWSTNEQDALRIIDTELEKERVRLEEKYPGKNIHVLNMLNSNSKMIDSWHHYCTKQMRQMFYPLDEHLTFSNEETTRESYASKKLPYPIEESPTIAYDQLMSTLYSEKERHKIEWAIGSVITGDSKKLQKFFVLYGAAGTGKSTVLNIIQKLFEGYYCVFDAKALGSSNNTFALEAFKTNPLIAIQHDGDLSRIEDNTRLNSLVSHELMTVNEKFKSTYSVRFNSILFMGTNKPVRITDSKSGIIRRLVDISPTGETLKVREYKRLVKQIPFELGGIASKCRDVYLKDPGYYDDYIPFEMLGASNDFYNFMIDSYHTFKKDDGTTLKIAWEMYKQYCDEANVPYPYSQRVFKEELKSYFWSYEDRFSMGDGSRVRSYYNRFRTDKFEVDKDVSDQNDQSYLIKFESGIKSIFDMECSDCPAQYANDNENPSKYWDDVTTTLSQLDTSKLHYVRVPENHIVIDFDLKDQNGDKSFELNLEEASKWPDTYAELSKSGGGIHLHYIYTGDVSKLSRLYSKDIEIKVFTGKSSLRRKLSKCNNLPINTISSGLPLRGNKKMIDFKGFKNEQALRTTIERNLRKEICHYTKPSIDLIYKDLERAYESGMKYDVSNMINDIFAFASSSTHQAPYCQKLVSKMHFQSKDCEEKFEEPSKIIQNEDLVFFDAEVFPNLFLINWKYYGKDKKVVRMINPTAEEVERLCRMPLVGFNCRRYDNHMLYANILGYSNLEIYRLSQKIIVKKDRNAFFGEAYNISYTDVFDFASAQNKMSLKKWEIELGMHHQELDIPWDEPVDESLWLKVAEYCDNDVIATEAVFDHLQADWKARQILADIAGMSVNSTTNSLTTKIVFGNDRKPSLVYTDLSETFPGYEYTMGDDKKPHNMYRGVDMGFGGYVYAEPGMYSNVALLDVSSMHPHSITAMNCFGKYTDNFKALMDARLYIKHDQYDKAAELFNGKLKPYLSDPGQAKALSTALKTAINSVYGLTSASFDNPFRDNRNKNNIVALRGALFMKTLQDEVTKRGFTVVHIKTDSIKIANATPEIIDFCMEFAKKYQYEFEHEATYERICLVNNAVYIAKDASDGHWTATGAEFQHPYVFKKIFSKEEIEFEDLCETKSTQTSFYLDMNEGLKEGEHNYIFVGRVGSFCPIKMGCGGGELMRVQGDKYNHATGTKGYRWMESEMVKNLRKEECIDYGYYENLVNDAIEHMSQFGDYEMFVSDDPFHLDDSYLRDDDTPPWE